jgi:putative peptidoglycan lipid II flippase
MREMPKNKADMGNQAEAGNRKSTLSTILLMACTASSRLFGFVKQALIAALFGASGNADALNAIFNVPNNLRKLFAEGAFSSAFIPVLSTAILEDRSGNQSRTLVRNLLALQVLILVPLVGLSLAFPEFFVRVLTSFSNKEKIPVASELLRWMFSYTLFVSLSAVLMAVLNSHGKFAVPALSPLVFSLAIILSMILLGKRLGVVSMGVGVLIGGILQLVVQIPAFMKQGYDCGLDFKFSNPRFIQTVKLWVPYLASASIFTINQFLATFFASGLEDGSVSSLANAVMFLQIPYGIFSASIITVVFPRMSRQAAEKDIEGLRDSLGYGMEFLIMLLIPASLLLVLMGKEIISLTLQRMSFTAGNTLMASRVLTGYAVGLLSMGIYNMLQRLFYALKEFKTPIVSALIIAVVDVAFSLWLKQTQLRVAGLAVANSIAFTVGIGYLLLVSRARLHRIGAGRMAEGLIKSIISSIPMAAFLILFRIFAGDLWSAGSSFKTLLWVAGAVGISMALTLGMFALLRVPFVMDVLRRRKLA